MEYQKYNFAFNSDVTLFEFTSVGKLSIPKLIRFSPTSNEHIYNLGFGDKYQIDEKIIIDDKAVSNNGDAAKILATIANAIFVFTLHNPDKYVFFTGVTPSRIRLYRMAISLNYDELSDKFIIFAIVEDGLTKDVAVPFKENLNAKGFLIKRK